MSKFTPNKDYEKGVLYCTVRWSNHNNNVNQFLSMNYAEEKYTDVVIACEGHILKAHKMILAGCSPYFEMLFNNYETKLQPYGQPMCIVLDGMGISYPTLQLILEFMYGGEIRVKKSELESLVKGGVKLKVKGLDAVKLGDKTPDKPTEGRTVIGRSEVKAPQMVPKLATTPRAGVQPAKDSSPRKRVIEILHKMSTPSSPKAPVSRAKQSLSQRHVPSAMTALKREAPDTDKVPDERQAPQETVVGERSATSDKDSQPATQQDKESASVPNANQPEEEPAEPPKRTSPRKPAVEPEPEPAATPEDTSKVPEELPTDTDSVEQHSNSEDTESKTEDGGDENGEAEAEPVSKRRTIKKPARLSDNDFVQEIKMPPMKKRKVRESPSRKQLAEENAESAPAEEAAAPEPGKRRKGVFYIFCQEFREKLQSENPDESNSEITKRLSTMWKNLDPSEKEKYAQPPKANKK